jgi:TolB-like protein/class 3 adenylate cyclase/Tfp pilus assembly protein PilF
MTATRRLAAILAADVAGYSRLMGADEEGTHERLKAHLRELVEPKISEHRGRIVKNTGDGFLTEFASVVDAVRCAVGVQRGMADREPDVAEERRIRFRIGINLGDVIAEEHDIFGDGVNVAARLEALAEPGGICVSRVVRDQVRDKLDFAFADMGEQSVKNIARPVRVYAFRPEAILKLPLTGLPLAVLRRRRGTPAATAAAVVGVFVAAVGGWWFWPATKPASTAAVAAATSIAQPLVAPRLSIVVLPFANLSNDPDQQYFADGITDDLTTNLSRISDSFVISRNTAFTYRNKPVDTKQIGRELGVRYVLEGSVRRAGDKVRVNAQLINAEADAHLWADQFDGDTDDLFALQNEITGRLANALGIELIAAEAARPAERPDALDYIFRGHAAGLKPASRASYAEAIRLYEHALAIDPQSVEAQSRLALSLADRVLDLMTDTAAADIARAEALVGQALAAEPRSALVHAAKGEVLRAQSRWEDAIPEYETVLAFYRNSPAALHALGQCKLFTGFIEEVIPLAEQAIRLSPRDPYIGNFFQRIGLVHLLQSRIDEAVVWLEKARSANPEHWFAHVALASAYGLKGETERAAAELAEARRLRGEGSLSSISQARKRVREEFVAAPNVRALYEATVFAGLRKAGMPEE